LLLFLPCLFPEKATADAVFIYFPGFNIDNSDLNTGFSTSNADGSASGSSFSGNLIRVGAFSDNPTTLIGGLTAITSPSAILANLESKFTQYTSFTFSNTFLLGNDASAYPQTIPETTTPLVDQPSIEAGLRGKDIYLLFYNAATAAAADQLAIFRMKDSAINGPTGSDLAGIFSTQPDPYNYISSFYLYYEQVDMLLGQYVADTFVLGKLSGGVGQITSATTLIMNSESVNTYQILSNNGADSYALTAKPSWASIDAATGIITLSPSATDIGTFTLELSAANSLTGNTASGSLSVRVVPPSTPPTFTSSATVAATAGVDLTHTISTSAACSFTTTSALPNGLTLSETGVLSGIPKDEGRFPIIIRATRTANADSFNDQTLVLTVTLPTLAIAALDSNSQLTRTAGTTYTIPVTIPSGFQVDSYTISPKIPGDTISGITYSAGNLVISSTAIPLAKGTTSQTMTLTLSRTSGLGGSTVSASKEFKLRLVAPAPTALTTAGPFEVNVGEDYSLQLLTDVSAFCPNQNIAIVGTLPYPLENIKVNVDALKRESGVITGKNTSTTLPWEFPVNVVADTSTFYEGGGTKTFPIIFRLRNPLAPVITSSLSRLAGVGKSFLSYKLEASGNPSTFTASGLPPGLALTKEFNITGTPTQAGIYDVRLDAYNSYRPGSTLASDLQSGTATLRIFVSGSKPTTATPLSGSSNLQVGNAASFSMLSAEQLGLRISGYGFPPGLKIDPSTGLVTGTPTAAGTYSVTIFIQNGKGWIKKAISLTVR
jgi:hypothetical protein